MSTRDSLSRFLFENFPVRGELAHLSSAWKTVLARRDYPPSVRQVLGEAMAAAALLFATIKFKGQLTLQLQGKGQLGLMVVQCTDVGMLRATAQWSGTPAPMPLSDLCGGGTLAITLEPESGRERYQGIVEITGVVLADALEQYFARSEQLPTRLFLAADSDNAAGLLVQRLPGAILDADAWQRIQHLSATITPEELLSLEARETIHRLFHEEDVRLMSEQPLGFRCSCSRERTVAVIRSLGIDDVRQLLAEQDTISVNCEFCGMEYRFDPVDAMGLFTNTLQPDTSATRH